MSKKTIKIKQELQVSEVVTYLGELAQALESGSVKAESGTDSIVLNVPESVSFGIKMSRKENKSKLSIKLKWMDDVTVESDETPDN